jgi:hypothetical protein
MEEDKHNKFWRTLAIRILIIGAILGFIYFLIFWVDLMTTNFNIERFECTGTIGDTIGGLTAPIIGIAGSILVYLSFQAQLKANKMQFKALLREQKRYEEDRLRARLYLVSSDIKDSVKELEFIGFDNEGKEIVYKGLTALKQTAEQYENDIIDTIINPGNQTRRHHDFNTAFASILYILSSIDELLCDLDNNSESEDAYSIKSFFNIYYKNVVRSHVHLIVKHLPPESPYIKIKEKSGIIDMYLQDKFFVS